MNKLSSFAEELVTIKQARALDYTKEQAFLDELQSIKESAIAGGLVEGAGKFLTGAGQGFSRIGEAARGAYKALRAPAQENVSRIGEAWKAVKEPFKGIASNPAMRGDLYRAGAVVGGGALAAGGAKRAVFGGN